MGTIDVAYNVDATALFYSRPKPDMSKLITELNERLSQFNGSHMQMSPLSHEDWWLLSCPEFHIMIAFSDAPSTDTRLLPAAKSPVCDLRRFDYVQVVEGHQASLQIEVGDGHAPLPPEARTIMQEFGESATCDPKLKMMALHWTTQFIARHVGFLALHFGPSDRIFCPEEVTESASLDLPIPLLMHPVPSMPEPGPRGADGYHLRLKNPHHLDGPAITLEGIPIAIPLRTSVSLLNTLFKARANNRIDLAHGKVIKPSAKLALYAREEDPNDAALNGEVILSFWKERGHDLPRAQNSAPPVDAAPSPVAPLVLKPKPAPAPEPVPVAPPTVSAEPALDDQFEFEAEPAAIQAENHEQAKATSKPRPMQTDPHDLADRLMERAGATLEPQPDHVAERLEDVVPATPLPQTKPRRRGPHMWFINRLKNVPLDSRAKIAGLAVIIGLQVLWAPYSDFTGGLSAVTAETAESAPDTAQQAFLTE